MSSFEDLPPFYDMNWLQEDGRLSADAVLYLDQTFQSINKMNNGMQMPIKTTAQIATLEPSVPVGSVWFNSDVAKLQVKTAAGVIETVTSV